MAIDVSLILKDGVTAVAKNMASGVRDVDEAVKDVGENNGLGKLGSSANGAMGMIGSLAKKAIAITGIVGIPGMALKKGFERLETIDTAKAKLSGLGHDAKGIESIMDSASKAVTDTAFGLGDAATAAGTAAAAGIKTGDDMTRYLSDIADASAIAGTDMNDMAAIFNKVANNGKMSAEELNQLADRGIPIMSYLADATGKSMGEVRDAVSNGEVSIETLQKAIHDHIGGAAQEMGKKSLRAAIDNTWAALGRFGAALLDGGGKGQGLFSQLKPMFDNLKETINKLTEKAKPIGEILGAVFVGAIKGAKTFFKVMKALFAPIGFLLKHFVKLKGGKKNYEGLTNAVSKLVAVVLALVTAYKVYQAVQKVQKALNKSEVVQSLLKIKAKIAEAAATRAAKKAQDGLNRSMWANPYTIIIVAIIAVVTVLIVLQKKFHIFNKLWGVMKTVAKKVVDAFKKVVEFFKGIPGFFKDKFEKVRNFVGGAVEKIKGKFKEFGSKAKDILFGQFNIIATGAKAIAHSKLGQGVAAGAKFAWKAIKFYMFAARHPVKALKMVIKGFKDYFQKAGEIIKSMLGGIKDKFDTVFEKIGGFISPIVDKVNDFLEAIGKIPGAIKALPGKAGEKIEELFGEGGENLVPGAGFARGTNFAPGGPAIVGENGPELVNLPRGAQVKTASATRQILSGATRNKAQNVSNKTLHIAKIAEQLVIREEADIDKLTMKIARLMGEEDYSMA